MDFEGGTWKYDYKIDVSQKQRGAKGSLTHVFLRSILLSWRKCSSSASSFMYVLSSFVGRMEVVGMQGLTAIPCACLMSRGGGGACGVSTNTPCTCSVRGEGGGTCGVSTNTLRSLGEQRWY